MDIFTKEDLKRLLEKRPGACLSVYLPTHRGGAKADPIAWKNLLATADDRLATLGMSHSARGDFLSPAQRLLDDGDFWRHQSDGLAFFLAEGLQRCFRLPCSFALLAVVGERFHIQPLVPLLSGDGRFFLLAFSQNAVRLFQGTRASICEVDPKGVPANLAEALQFHDRDEPLMFHGRRTSSGGWGMIFHGQGVGIDDHKDDLLRYFQAIDKGLHELLKTEQAPLVLATVDYLLPIYRQANKYAHLLPEGIIGNPDRASSQELHERAWALLGPHFQERQQRALAQYRQLDGTGRTSSELAQLLVAAHAGQVETLLVARGQQRWGRFDPASQEVAEHPCMQAGDEDLLNLAAVFTLAHDRAVYVLEAEQMPEGKPLAGVFCLPLAKH